MVTRLLLTATLVCGLAWSLTLNRTEAGEKTDVTLQLASLKQLEAEIAKHKGKVVVIDFWATYCIPCKEEFHNIVRLNKEHAKDGLVCMSITVDAPQKKDSALKFLQSEKATFQNFLVDEEEDGKAHEKWGFQGVPAVVVYGTDGKVAKSFIQEGANTFTYKDVEAFLTPLIKK